ncbi:MAG TPA: NAD-dependent succinate-semialdehyde dehydrogenase [Trebonia sp.]|nr:NAD-dependent succinate-semialdehyde dehydrogenase [Trebonia sp.]
MRIESSMYVNGEWVAGTAEPFDVIDPATEEVIGPVPTATSVELNLALEAAAQGWKLWSATPGWSRAAVLDKMSALIRADAEGHAELLSREQGKPMPEARAEVTSAADYFQWFADEGRRIYGRVVDGRTVDRRLLVLHEAVGPVAAFTPNNFPWLLPARKVAAALAAGCSVILKPAEDVPLSALALARVAHEAGLPAGVLNVVTGDPAHISETLVGSPVIRKVSLTGSVPVGRSVLAQSARGVKKVSMELGGHAPVIVLPGSDPVATATSLVAGKFRNCGQVCVSPSRAFVPRPIYDEFVEEAVRATGKLVVGAGTDDGTDVGPLISERRRAAVEAMVNDARDKGATVATGGARSARDRGYYYEPTVLTNVSRSMSVMVDEPFGPILPIIPYDDLDEAIEEANSLEVGLAGYVYGPDLLEADRVSRRLDVGVVGLNTYAVATAEAPFGGVKQSGFGSEGGLEGIQEYLRVRYVNAPC